MSDIVHMKFTLRDSITFWSFVECLGERSLFSTVDFLSATEATFDIMVCVTDSVQKLSSFALGFCICGIASSSSSL